MQRGPFWKTNTDLRKGDHSIMLTQIQFGTYRCGEKLSHYRRNQQTALLSNRYSPLAYLKLKG